ncbi:MAG: NF038122 family metalloprotease [Planctomycetota bacterium]
MSLRTDSAAMAALLLTHIVAAPGLVSAAHAQAPAAIDREIRVVHPVAGCRPVPADMRAEVDGMLERLSQRRDLVPASVRLDANLRGAVGFDVQYFLSPAVAADTAFVQALEHAAQAWESIISDDAVVQITVDFTENQSFLAAAGGTRYTWNYPSLRSNIIPAAAPFEAAFVGALPDVMSFQSDFGAGDTDGQPNVIIRDGTYQSLGFPTLDTDGSPDAGIVFNTDFDFDSDPSDGITSGSFDTVYIMIHEIGHVLGFTSSVDTGGSTPTVLDIYRVGTLGAANDPGSLAELTAADREYRANVEAALDPVGQFPGFDEPLRFSTGRNNGDGRQASHWKDDALLGLSTAIGVMDPTYNFDTLNPGYISEADKLAFSLLGWDIDVQLAPIDPCSPADITTEGTPNGEPDGVVTLSDFSFYLSLWSNSDPGADITTDGVCNVGNGGDGVTLSDFSCYLSTWSLGCP